MEAKTTATPKKPLHSARIGRYSSHPEDGAAISSP